MITTKKPEQRLNWPRLLPWCAAAVLLISGCADYRTINPGSPKPEGPAGLNVTNCSNASDPNEFVLVKIFFNEQNCPLYVDNPVFVLRPSEQGKPAKVVWQAYSASDETILNNNYQIYFDPFKDGRTLKVTNSKGCLTSGQLMREYPGGQPSLIFEYIITAEHKNAPSEHCLPLDPRFLVD